jgi:hypothetical protein
VQAVVLMKCLIYQHLQNRKTGQHPAALDCRVERQPGVAAAIRGGSARSSPAPSVVTLAASLLVKLPGSVRGSRPRGSNRRQAQVGRGRAGGRAATTSGLGRRRA